MGRVVMIGIGGLDADLLRVYGPSLPHLRRLMLESPFLELKSSFPPLAAPAWASSYTGLNPANHGVLGFGNITSPAGSRSAEEMALPEFAIPQGETFWDMAGRAGKRVCVINPLLAYPAWPVNGVMLSLPPVEASGCGRRGYLPPRQGPESWGQVSSYGYPTASESVPRAVVQEAETSEPFPSLFETTLLPATRQLEGLCQSLHRLTLQQADIAMELFNREPWDLFFLQLDALDHVQHLLWRYSDPGDPAYPGRNQHASRIFDFYRLFDQIVGRFRTAMEEECVLIVVSGHGHGRSCDRCFHLNEWLRAQDLLTPRLRSVRLLDHRYLVERAKYHATELLCQLHLQKVLLYTNRFAPGRQALPYTASRIDQQATLAQVADLAGISPYGGIMFNRAGIERKGDDYEQVRMSLLQRLLRLRLKGRPLVAWAKIREDIYQGKYIEYYPDILFELRSEFGISGNIFVPLTTSNLMHHAVSGDHRMHGVLLIGNLPEDANILESMNEPTVMDVAPTVLHLLDVVSAKRDGQALILPCVTQVST